MAGGRSIVNLIAVDPRGRINSLFLENSAYVQNAPCIIFFHCSVEKALNLSLNKVALLSRAAISEQVIDAQIMATAKAAYISMIEGGNPPLVGDATIALIVSSSWAPSGFLNNCDFSPAVANHAGRRKGKKGRRGLPTYYHIKTLEGMAFPTSSGINTGGDTDGNLWLMEYLRRYL